MLQTTLSLAMLVASAVPLSGAQAQTVASAEANNEEIIRAAFARWADGGTGFFDEVLAPDVVWTIKGSGSSAGVFHSRQALLDKAVAPFTARLSSPVHPTVHTIWSKGDQVAVHWDGEAVARDGKPYHNSYVWIFRMRDGKAVEAIAYLDLVPYDDVFQRIPLD